MISIIIPSLHLLRPRNLRSALSRRYTLAEVLRDVKDNISAAKEVILICNGTSPELRWFVEHESGADKYALNSTNVGVARAWNMGAMMAEGDALCFINDDVAAGRGAIDTLYQELMADPAIGEVGPKGARWAGTSHDRYVGQTAKEDADAISGFLFMMRTNIFFAVGGFDVNYTPAGFEEIDMSFAIRRHGFRCTVIPHLDVAHHGCHGVSSSAAPIQYFNQSIGARELHARNRAYFARKWSIADDLPPA